MKLLCADKAFKLLPVLSTGLFCLVALSVNQALFANPNTANPDDGLEVRDHPTSAQLAAKAFQLAGEAERELSDWEQQLEEGKPSRANVRDLPKIGKIAVSIKQLMRAAEQLIILHEPAGHDYRFRASQMEGRLSTVVAKYKQLPDFGKTVSTAGRTLTGISTRNKGQLSRIGSWFKQGKLDLAERGIYETFDELTMYGIWVDRSTYARAAAPFNGAKKTVDEAILVERKSQAVQLLEELRESHDPQFEVAKARLNNAIESIAEQSQADWEGETFTGPQLVAAWGRLWRDVQNKTLAARVIEYAQGERANSRPPSAIDTLQSEFETFSNDLAESLAKLIKADTSRVKPEEAFGLYTQYVAAIGELAAFTSDDRLEKAVEPALAELAATVPGLPTQIDGYRRATSAILRWRARAAEVRAADQMAQDEQLPVEEVALQAAQPGENNSPGLGRVRSSLNWEIAGPAPAVVKQISEQSVGKLVYVEQITPLAEATDSVSQYDQRLYAELIRARISPKKIEQLKKDLLVSPNAPPLTVTAARAIRSAELGVVKAGGGEVMGVTLRGYFVEFVSENQFATGIPLGMLPKEVDRMEPADQAMLSYQIRPKWLRHEFIFQELP